MCTRVNIGVNRCGWAGMGALGSREYEGTHKRYMQGQKLPYRPCFGTYGRGNSPGHHVLGCLAKNGVDECRWIKSGFYGCVWTQRQGGRQKQGEKSPKWARCGRFVKYVHAKKSKEGGAHGYRVRGGAFKGIWV